MCWSARKQEGVCTLLEESRWFWCYQTVSPSLSGVQEKLGVMNKGLVYALWDYTPQQPDELSFSEGDALAVLRRGDDMETEWWWARLNDHEGYVPRNLLGVRTHQTPGHTEAEICSLALSSAELLAPASQVNCRVRKYKPLKFQRSITPEHQKKEAKEVWVIILFHKSTDLIKYLKSVFIPFDFSVALTCDRQTLKDLAILNYGNKESLGTSAKV